MFPADFPDDDKRDLNLELKHARSQLDKAVKRGVGVQAAREKLDRAMRKRSLSIKSFVDRVNTHTSLVVAQDGDRTRRCVREEGEKTMAEFKAMCSGDVPTGDFPTDDAELQHLDASAVLINARRSKLRRIVNKKRKASEITADDASAGQSITSVKVKTVRARVRAPIDFDQVRIIRTNELPGDVELGPNCTTLEKSMQDDIQANFKLERVPPDLLDEVVEFMNLNMNRFRIHKVARKQSDLDERPKLVFAILHPDH
jgi:hypothetical protein